MPEEIKRTSIKLVEKKTQKKIRRNSFSVGIDVAEKYTGICIVKSDNNWIYIENLSVITTSEKEDHFNRADHFVAALEKFKQTLSSAVGFKIVVIERCFYGKNVETLIHLAHFGILAYIILKREFDTYYYYGASTARSIIGFNQRRQEALGNLQTRVITKGKNKGNFKKIDCKSLVHDYLNTDFNLIISNKDEADAYVLALAGLLS